MTEPYTSVPVSALCDELESILLAAGLPPDLSARLAKWSGDYRTHISEAAADMAARAVTRPIASITGRVDALEKKVGDGA